MHHLDSDDPEAATQSTFVNWARMSKWTKGGGSYQAKLASTHNSDPLTMVKCEPFVGKPGSNTTGAQPFEMTVHSNVLLMMDFHAHLMTTEIIGFLAGEWDKTTRRK
jgi:hypothetical protein